MRTLSEEEAFTLASDNDIDLLLHSTNSNDVEDESGSECEVGRNVAEVINDSQ